MPANTVNFGNQSENVKYHSSADSSNVNNRLLNIMPRGIYEGGYLTRVNDGQVTLSTLWCEIGDNSYQLRIQTTTTVSITTITPSLPYVVLRWNYYAQTNNYMEVACVASPSINELIVGKGVYTGSTLSTIFDYSQRSNPIEFAHNLLVQPTQVASTSIQVRGGLISFGTTTAKVNDIVVDLSSDISSLIAGQSRIDVIVSDSTGAISVLTGVAATTGSQLVPSYGLSLALAEVTLVYGQTTITSTSIKVVSNAARFSGNAVLLTTDQSVGGVKTFGSTPVLPIAAPTLDTQAANKKYVDDSFTTKAVLLTTDQNVTGVKTFSSFPVTPTAAPTTNYQVANKKYVDDAITNDNAVLLTGSQSVAGIKTFTSFPETPSSAPSTYYQVANKKYVDDQDALDVHLTGDQTITSGVKTFAGGLVIENRTNDTGCTQVGRIWLRTDLT